MQSQREPPMAHHAAPASKGNPGSIEAVGRRSGAIGKLGDQPSQRDADHGRNLEFRIAAKIC